jgi:hypothetical protein
MNKHWRKPKGQSRMNNPEKLATSARQDTWRRQTLKPRRKPSASWSEQFLLQMWHPMSYFLAMQKSSDMEINRNTKYNMNHLQGGCHNTEVGKPTE